MECPVGLRIHQPSLCDIPRRKESAFKEECLVLLLLLGANFMLLTLHANMLSSELFKRHIHFGTFETSLMQPSKVEERKKAVMDRLDCWRAVVLRSIQSIIRAPCC